LTVSFDYFSGNLIGGAVDPTILLAELGGLPMLLMFKAGANLKKTFYGRKLRLFS
jgi:hypothetical protein